MKRALVKNTGFFFLLFFATSVVAFDFVDKTLDDFIARVVALEDQQSFKPYYQDFIVSLKKLSPAKRKVDLQVLREHARCSLEVKHPEWAQSLKPVAFYEREENNYDIREVRTFLTRYAVYEQFCENKALEHATLWHRVKSYSKHVSSKVTGWVNGLLPQKKTT